MVDRNCAFRAKRLAACCALALLATGCGSHVEGTPLPPTDVSSSTTPPRHGAPQVANSVDVSRFLPQPCAALTAAQLQALTLDSPGRPDTTGALAEYAGPGCTWDNKDVSVSVMFSFMTGNKNGLADIYRGHEQGQFPGYFDVTTVDGFPAVFTSGVDGRAKGFCSLHTGISDTLEILVDESTRAGKDACAGAWQTTSLILKTLRGG
jgi:hypothetical protein